jgi:PPIC-type PPIASE domain
LERRPLTWGPVNRPLLAIAGAVALAIAVSSCSTTNPDAATVNGVHIKRTPFEADMNALAKNEAYAKANEAAAAQGAPAIFGATKGSISSAFAGTQLSNLVLLEFVHAELGRRNVTPDAEQLTQGEQVAQGILAVDDPVTWTSLPAGLKTKYSQKGAEYLALQKQLAPKTDAELQAVFASVEGQLPFCLSRILVASEADAATVADDLKAGKAFADVAKARSIDEETKDTGGTMVDPQSGQCRTTKTLDPAIVTAARAAKLGEPTAPVKTKEGFNVIQVDQALPTMESLRDKLVTFGGQQSFKQFIDKSRKEAVVSIDPHYGMWDAAKGELAATKPAGTATEGTVATAPKAGALVPGADPATSVSTP